MTGLGTYYRSLRHRARKSGLTVLTYLLRIWTTGAPVGCSFLPPPRRSLPSDRKASAFARMKVRPSPRHTRPLCPHDRSNVCCLLCAQLNIANPSTGKQKLIEIEDEKKLASCQLHYIYMHARIISRTALVCHLLVSVCRGTPITVRAPC